MHSVNKKNTLIATCKGLGIKLDPDAFDVDEDGVVTINKDYLPSGSGTSITPEKGEPGTPGKDEKDGKDGVDGITPHIGDNGNWYLGDTDTGKPSRGADGKDGAPGTNDKDGTPGTNGKDGSPGADGADGITPHIGSNGNWYIGDTDTGMPSQGAKGEKGEPGTPGADGKDGAPGAAGKDGAPGADGADGEKGEKGEPGKDGAPGADGNDGVGIESVTGTIDASNTLSLVFILTDGSTQTVTGQITPTE